jgi:competence protein ComEC
MLAIYLCTRLLYRERALLNALGAAALVLMVADPRTVTDSSFQLTFLSVLAICGIAVPLIERTSQPYRAALRWLASTDYDMSLAPHLAQFRIDLRLIADTLARLFPRIPEPLSRLAGRRWRRRTSQSIITGILSFVASAYELLVVSFTTQIALALPMAWYFHRATVAGLPANLIAVPLTGVMMPASVAAVALSYVWMPLARIPARIASWTVTGITWTVDVFGRITIADLRVATPEMWAAMAVAAAFVLALLFARRRKLLASAGVAALCLSAIWIAAMPPKPALVRGKLEITAIDVGQAESFLVVTPEGHTLLVDAAGSLGPWQSEFDFGEDVIAPYLWSRGITRLDAVAVTHAHSDHYGGMSSILKIFRPREMWVGPNAPDSGYEAFVRQAKEAGVLIVPRSGGDAFSFGSAHVRVLAPAPRLQTASKPKNDDSLVLWFGHGGTSALLEADAEKSSERQMLGSNLKSDLLKVAHNGSNSSSTPEFLAEVQPRYALISVGARNSFGHPRPEVLERLAAMHVRTYRTDLLGAITFLLDGREVVVRLPVLENR